MGLLGLCGYGVLWCYGVMVGLWGYGGVSLGFSFWDDFAVRPLLGALATRLHQTLLEGQREAKRRPLVAQARRRPG